LWYSRSKDFTLITYRDAYWAESVDDDKSTSGGAFFIGNCLVSWLSKKQTLISLSIAKVKYIVAVSCCTQVLWMKQAPKDIKEKCDHPISIICDNTNAISMSKNHVMHSNTKHVPIKYHFLRE